MVHASHLVEGRAVRLDAVNPREVARERVGSVLPSYGGVEKGQLLSRRKGEMPASSELTLEHKVDASHRGVDVVIADKDGLRLEARDRVEAIVERVGRLFDDLDATLANERLQFGRDVRIRRMPRDEDSVDPGGVATGN